MEENLQALLGVTIAIWRSRRLGLAIFAKASVRTSFKPSLATSNRALIRSAPIYEYTP